MFFKRSLSLVLALGLVTAPLQASVSEESTLPETFASEALSQQTPIPAEALPPKESTPSSAPKKDLLSSIIHYAAYGETFGAGYYSMLFLIPKTDEYLSNSWNHSILDFMLFGPLVCSLVKGGASLLKLTQKEVRKELFTPSSLKSIGKHSLLTLFTWTPFITIFWNHPCYEGNSCKVCRTLNMIRSRLKPHGPPARRESEWTRRFPHEAPYPE
jgi:hypothetical protein